MVATREVIKMPHPFKCKRMVVRVHGVVVGVVEGLAIELIKEGGTEPVYGKETQEHAKGTRRATFSIRRWCFVDKLVGPPVVNRSDLLFDLFDRDIPFTLEAGISTTPSGTTIASGKKVVLSDCEIYRWRPVTGASNDIVAEEAVGEAVDWTGTEVGGDSIPYGPSA